MAVASMVVAITGLSRPLAIVMVSSGSLGAAGTVAMVGNTRAIEVAGLSRSLANALDASGNIAGATITMVGNGRSVVVTKAGLSGPLANTMMDIQAIMRVGSGDMLMAVTSIVVSIPRLSRPLAKMVESMIVAMSSLGASCNITSGSIAVVSNSWAVIAEASFSSDTAQNGQNLKQSSFEIIQLF